MNPTKGTHMPSPTSFNNMGSPYGTPIGTPIGAAGLAQPSQVPKFNFGKNQPPPEPTPTPPPVGNNQVDPKVQELINLILQKEEPQPGQLPQRPTPQYPPEIQEHIDKLSVHPENLLFGKFDNKPTIQEAMRNATAVRTE